MAMSRFNFWFPVLVLLCAGLCCMPALAANETITIAYRSSGGYYIGDTIIFDGINKVGNMTVIKITGPGLPTEGVPLYDLSGTPGTGNTVPVDSRNYWIFAWDTWRIDDSKLQTARYTFIAWDKDNPSATATTSIILKKPEFYMIVKPSTARMGDYVELDGMAEKGVTYMKIDVTDSAGTTFHTFIAPVSATGFFQYGFHVDMKPGEYSIKGTNPTMRNDLTVGLSISAPNTTGMQIPEPVQTTPSASPETTIVPSVTTPTPIKTQAGTAATTVLLSVCILGVIIAFSRRDQ
ncbi:MAG: hypothetical protein A4E35_01811 [Methanoregula sp. PtaU1.Bin051]|nr:MAG: hypothetical protein A4E35_01811 [Methanoregula sp. PtaU1.Bin051]